MRGRAAFVYRASSVDTIGRIPGSSSDGPDIRRHYTTRIVAIPRRHCSHSFNRPVHRVWRDMGLADTLVQIFAFTAGVMS